MLNRPPARTTEFCCLYFYEIPAEEMKNLLALCVFHIYITNQTCPSLPLKMASFQLTTSNLFDIADHVENLKKFHRWVYAGNSNKINKEICEYHYRVYVITWFSIMNNFESWCNILTVSNSSYYHDDVIKWKHVPRYWTSVRWPMNSHQKGQWRGALIFPLIYALNKRLSKQLCGWWFEAHSHSLWRHFNDG